MARKPNYNFERKERERAKAAKKAARLEAKRDKAEKKNTDSSNHGINGNSYCIRCINHSTCNLFTKRWPW